MQQHEGDKRYHLPSNTPLLTPERAAKGDVLTGPPCPDCKATGRVKNQLGVKDAPCRTCRGKGWTGSVNAASIAASDIRFAQVQVVNILNFLWEGEVISDDEHGAGHTFEAWRNQHRVSLGLQRPVSGELEETLQVKLRAYGFVLLSRRLGHSDAKAINKALDVTANYATRAEAWRERHAYQAAFGRLARVIGPIRDQVAYLEGASQQERDELSDEQMKKLLAEIRDGR